MMPRDRTPTALTPEQVLTGLNEALRAEHQAVADYAAHADACDRLDMREALEALRDVECEHARCLALRIGALGGEPASAPIELQSPGDALADWLASDLASEQWAIVEYARLVAGIVDDDETAELMTELLVDEISHAGWLKSAIRDLRGR